MAEMIWKIGIDKAEALLAGKMFAKGASENKNVDSSSGILKGLSDRIKDLSDQREEATDTDVIKKLNKEISSLNAQRSKLKGEKGGGAGAFAGGFVGSILGSILSSVKQLFDPLNAIASLLVAALFPILKPFLILFIKIGLLLYKWLNAAFGTKSSAPGTVGKDADGNTVIGEKGKEMGNTVAGIGAVLFVLLASLGAFGAAVAGWPLLVIGAIAIAVAYLVKKAFELGLWLGDKLADLIWWIIMTTKDAWYAMVDILKSAWVTIVGWVSAAWDWLVELLKKSWEGLKLFGQWIWDALVVVFTAAWDILKTFGKWIWDGLVSIFTTSFQALSGIGQWIKDKIKSMFSLFGGGSGTGTAVNDAIITPNGDIIRTNPSDYLIATKNPSALMGGGAGGMTLNVNITGGMVTEDIARQVGKIIVREIKQGGGF